MGVLVKKKDKIDTGTLYVRGVTVENLKFFNSEAERLNYDSMGEYINTLARAMREEIINAGGDPVRYKARSKTKSS